MATRVQTLTLPPRPRARWWYGPLPIAAALALVALGVAAWCAFAEPLMPPRRELFDPAAQRFVDVPGADAPLYLRGRAAPEGLLILGDSRALADISLGVLRRRGIAPVALLWNGLAQLDHLLAAARELPPRRLLVCFSPASVHDRSRPNMAALLEEERGKRFTARLDERLDQAADDLRKRLVRPIRPEDFRGERFGGEVDPGAQVGIYRRMLAPKTAEERQRQFWELGLELDLLQDEGWRLAFLRLPVSPAMLETESRTFPPGRFELLSEALGVPYLDLSGEDYATFDGSHLLGEEAERVSERIASWLEELPGFLAE